MSRSCWPAVIRLATNATTTATYSSWRVCDPEVRRPDRNRGCRRRPRWPRASGGDTMNDVPQEYLARAIGSEAAVVTNGQASIKLGQSLPVAGLDVVCMADVKPVSIEWLWPNWIAI